MGGSACRCKCDNDDENPQGIADVKSDSWAEVPAAAEAIAPPATVNEAPAAPAVVESLANQPEPAPADKVESPAAAASTPEKAADADEGRRLVFQLVAGSTLGMRFLAEGAVVVSGIEPTSPLKTTSDNKLGLVVGDVIVKVDGKGGNKEQLLNALQESRGRGGNIEILAHKRPEFFEIVLTNNKSAADNKMGLVVVVQDEEPDRIEVRHVRDTGALTVWNDANPFLPVCGGDWVTKVGDDKSIKNAEDMITAMQKIWGEQKPLKLQIQTCDFNAPVAAG